MHFSNCNIKKTDGFWTWNIVSIDCMLGFCSTMCVRASFHYKSHFEGFMTSLFQFSLGSKLVRYILPWKIKTVLKMRKTVKRKKKNGITFFNNRNVIWTKYMKYWNLIIFISFHIFFFLFSVWNSNINNYKCKILNTFTGSHFFTSA